MSDQELADLKPNKKKMEETPPTPFAPPDWKEQKRRFAVTVYSNREGVHSFELNICHWSDSRRVVRISGRTGVPYKSMPLAAVRALQGAYSNKTREMSETDENDVLCITRVPYKSKHWNVEVGEEVLA